MGSWRAFGSVQPLDHAACDDYCRELCFEREDALGQVVRLSHEQWRAILAKENRALMGPLLPDVEDVIARPWQIHADTDDERHWIYYSEPSGPKDRLLTVAVKCIPRRFGGRWAQRRHLLEGLVRRDSRGEAWVSSAYFSKHPKSRGVRVWP